MTTESLNTKRHGLTQAINLFFGKAYYPSANSKRGIPITPLYMHDFGAIVLADANGVVESQDLTAAGVYSGTGIAGALATAGVATMDTPRNVVAAWTGAAIITVTGTDEYGAALVESSGSGTSFTGKKAFKTVTSVAVSANVTALTVGSGVVIGLPHRVDLHGLVIGKVDNATDACTFVPAVTTSPATATTGDVRGTVTFASAPDTTKTYAVIYKIASAETKVGAYGVTQYGG